MFRFRLRTLLLIMAIAAVATPRIYDWLQRRPITTTGFTAAQLASRLSDQRPVLVLFHARWNQQSQNQLSGKGDELWSIARENSISVMNADCTTRGSQGDKLMRRIGISKLPAYALYSPDDPNTPVVVGKLANATNLRLALKQLVNKDLPPRT